MVCDAARLYDPCSGHAPQQEIPSRYTMEDEKPMFDRLIETGDVRAALEQYMHLKQDKSGGSADIELL